MAIWVTSKGELIIGDGCGLSNSSIVWTHRVEILPETLIGGGCEIYDTDFHPVDAGQRVEGAEGASGPIVIGPKAFIGGWSIVLKNVRT